MRELRQLWKQLEIASRGENFLQLIGKVEGLIFRALSVAMVVVLIFAIYDLSRFLVVELLTPPIGRFGVALIEIFGLFLNVLIALEILENITAYLRKHVIQVELVIVTSLIAVARKIIIFDFTKTDSMGLIGLAIAVLALSISYWLIRQMSVKPHD